MILNLYVPVVNDAQSIFAPLVQMEADYDQKMKESQSQENLSVRWQVGLNKKLVAHFTFPKAYESKLVPGDELCLRYPGTQDPTRNTMSACRSVFLLLLIHVLDVFSFCSFYFTLGFVIIFIISFFDLLLLLVSCGFRV